MTRKRALVVDDSKSARVILSRMLEKYDIEVDMSESAEQAIDYLKQHRPDAIFMDQLMPGMDGLQAVQAIKGNPQTATIPIMMYTSQEGELYVGQARALGAMGVLPKQVRPVDVSKVLYELHLLPDRRDMTAAALEPVELDPATGVATLPALDKVPEPASDWVRKIELAVKDQGIDLRRFIVASLDSFANRIVSDARDAQPNPAVPEPVAVSANGLSRHWPWITAIVLSALVAVALGAALLKAQSELNKTREQLVAQSAVNTELKRNQQELSETVKDLTSALAANPFTQLSGGTNAGAASNAAIVRTEAVPYGEMPLDRARLEVLRDILLKLEAQSFRGVVKVTTHAGIFCLAGNANDGYALAANAVPLNKCESVGNPFEDSLSSAQRQSVAFANLITGIRQRSNGNISVTVENAGSAKAVLAYPARAESTTAGDWNKVASANNRVEFAIEPAAG